MQYKTVTLLALASSAVASPKLLQRQDDNASATAVDTNSIASVLLTALPSSLLSVALTNQGAVSSIIASEVAAGTPQPWISALPSDVQSYLSAAATAGASITAAPTATPTAGGNATSSIVSSIVAGNSSANATTTGSSASSSSSSEASTTSESSSESTSSGSSGASSSSTGGATLPTAIGAGLAGVVGIVGMLAL